ncbi:hypothetical protein LP416_02285 [Polaromonas sp. P2-4]|nr:hypothetical protein LP416_02285 [Polaromonas sp. P2-4]
MPYQIYKARTVKTAAECGFEVKRDELDWSAMDPEASSELEQVFGTAASITVDPSTLKSSFTIPEHNRTIVREYAKVLDKGYVDARGRADEEEHG